MKSFSLLVLGTLLIASRAHSASPAPFPDLAQKASGLYELTQGPNSCERSIVVAGSTKGLSLYSGTRIKGNEWNRLLSFRDIDRGTQYDLSSYMTGGAVPLPIIWSRANTTLRAERDQFELLYTNREKYFPGGSYLQAIRVSFDLGARTSNLSWLCDVEGKKCEVSCSYAQAPNPRKREFVEPDDCKFCYRINKDIPTATLRRRVSSGEKAVVALQFDPHHPGAAPLLINGQYDYERDYCEILFKAERPFDLDVGAKFEVTQQQNTGVPNTSYGNTPAFNFLSNYRIQGEYWDVSSGSPGQKVLLVANCSHMQLGLFKYETSGFRRLLETPLLTEDRVRDLLGSVLDIETVY